MARPRRPPPPPLETNDVRVAAAGAAAWAVALVVLLVIGLPEADRWWLWVCVVGIAIGLFGVLYIPRLQRTRAALIASHAGKHAAVDQTDAERPVADGTGDGGSAGTGALDGPVADDAGHRDAGHPESGHPESGHREASHGEAGPGGHAATNPDRRPG
ncbi:DUF2530 domain-containing protein [Actinomadura sp. HBU206391]|uniref:DUF2530 domain-containing protein n=1 Tax=Actinomadura sp. HBU206391 TaxID=2731692 RepID=UPI001650AF2D|nr:DUF2530 domain-containing protein [Actinomadura sp. HBU206391]